MIDNALRIMLFMWIISACLLAGQYLIMDEFGMILVGPTGIPLESHLVEYLDQDLFNEASESIVAGSNGTWNRVDELDISGAFVAWELVQLLSGTYVFNLLLLFGVPLQIVVVIVVGYFALLARAIVGYIRGI